MIEQSENLTTFTNELRCEGQVTVAEYSASTREKIRYVTNQGGESLSSQRRFLDMVEKRGILSGRGASGFLFSV